MSKQNIYILDRIQVFWDVTVLVQRIAKLV
jgi:hypothetical protein